MEYSSLANRRNVLIGAGAAVVVAAAGGAWYFLGRGDGGMSRVDGALPVPAGAEFNMTALMTPAGGVADHPVGAEDARVVMIEYLSPSCPHCATFANTVYPQLKAEYIDTGKIRFIPRPFMRNVLDAVVFMLAEAAGPEQYHEVIDTFFRTQNQWLASDKPNDAIFAIAQQLGFTKESYDAALTNQELFSGLEALKEQATQEFKLQGTPTFYINGKMLRGDTTFAALKAEIDPLLEA